MNKLPLFINIPSVDSDGERSNLSEVLHDSVLVVGLEDLVATEAHCRRHTVVVILAVPGHPAAGCVPVRRCLEF